MQSIPLLLLLGVARHGLHTFLYGAWHACRLSLEIEMASGIMITLIHHDTNIPTKKEQVRGPLLS